MYLIYLGASGKSNTVNITNPLPGETDDEMVQRYIANGMVADLPWQSWFQLTGDCLNYGAEFLVPDWQNQTCQIDQIVYTKYVQDQVLAQRQSLLQDSDWTQLPDIPEATRLAWQPYRQALRDIPSQSGYPFNVVWPEPPIINP